MTIIGWISTQHSHVRPYHRLTMDTSFSIDLSKPDTGSLFGILTVTMKEVKMTHETLMELIHILQSDLHFILTHMNQEGELDEEMFCQTSFQNILHMKDHVANFFGEDANVTLDRNVEFYRDACMDMLFHTSLQITMGAPIFSEDEGHWEYTIVSEPTIDRLEQILSGAEVM